jgi:hypothetical protein
VATEKEEEKKGTGEKKERDERRSGAGSENFYRWIRIKYQRNQALERTRKQTRHNKEKKRAAVRDGMWKREGSEGKEGTKYHHEDIIAKMNRANEREKPPCSRSSRRYEMDQTAKKSTTIILKSLWIVSN